MDGCIILKCLKNIKHHKDMYYNGCKFWIKILDDTKTTCDFGITAIFEVTNIFSRNDMHPQKSKKYTMELCI